MSSMSEAVSRYLQSCERTSDGCLVNPRLGPNKYGEVKWSGGRTTAHRAVLALHAGFMPDREIVARHKCDNPPCVEVEHLEFGTVSQNCHDTYRRRRRDQGWAAGESHSHILTANMVCEMRQLAAAGVGLGEIVAKFGTPYSPTRMAIRGETWKSLTDAPPVPGRKNRKPNPRAFRLTREADARTARAFAEDGLSLAEIAARLNVSRTTAWNLLRVSKGRSAA